MDINFKESPFTGYADFTNEELQYLWKNLYTKDSKPPDQIKFEKKDLTDKGTKITAKKNENFEEIEILYNEVKIFKDSSLLTTIYSLEQVNWIISMIIKNDRYRISFS